jgi:hypothetical protein
MPGGAGVPPEAFILDLRLVKARKPGKMPALAGRMPALLPDQDVARDEVNVRLPAGSEAHFWPMPGRSMWRCGIGWLEN